MHNVHLYGLLIGHNFANHFICIRNPKSNFLIFLRYLEFLFLSQFCCAFYSLSWFCWELSVVCRQISSIFYLCWDQSLWEGIQSIHRSGARRDKKGAVNLYSWFFHFVVVFSTIFSLFRKIIMKNSLRLLNYVCHCFV